MRKNSLTTAQENIFRDFRFFAILIHAYLDTFFSFSASSNKNSLDRVPEQKRDLPIVASFLKKKLFTHQFVGFLCFTHARGKKYTIGELQNKKHTQREKRESKMKCKVFAATTRSSRNMRQMEMEREECSEQQVQLDVKYCVCRFFFSFLFSLFSFLYLSSFGSGDDDNNKHLQFTL